MLGILTRAIKAYAIFCLLVTGPAQASVETESPIEISYPVTDGHSIDVMKKEWLKQFLAEYPGSIMNMDKMIDYVTTQHEDEKKVLTVSCHPGDFLVPTPALTRIESKAWLGVIDCDANELVRLRDMIGDDAKVEWVIDDDMDELEASPSWIEHKKLNVSAKGYRVQCVGNQLLWHGFDDSEMDSSWDKASFPYVDVPEVEERLEYIVQVRLSSQAEATGLLLALKHVEHLDQMEIIGSSKGLYTFSFRLKGLTPDQLSIWNQIEKVDGHMYSASWGHEDIIPDSELL